MRSNGMMKMWRKWVDCDHFIREKTKLLNKRDRKEHLVGCSEWENVGEEMAEHNITTQIEEKEGIFSICLAKKLL